MELKCSDCSYEEVVPDKSLIPEQCPQCGSKNINAYVGDRLNLICKDCNYEKIVGHRNFKDCPECGSSNIEIGVIMSAKARKKGIHPFLLYSIVCSLIGGIAATVFYVIYYSNFHIGFEPIPGRCCFNPGLWVVIPIGFGVGFLLPGIAWVISYL